METAGSSEMVSGYQMTWHHIPEDCSLKLNIDCCEDLMSPWDRALLEKLVKKFSVFYVN
jgi:hypothetical protein